MACRVDHFYELALSRNLLFSDCSAYSECIDDICNCIDHETLITDCRECIDDLPCIDELALDIPLGIVCMDCIVNLMSNDHIMDHIGNGSLESILHGSIWNGM